MIEAAHTLEFTISNQSGAPLEVGYAHLPWIYLTIPQEPAGYLNHVIADIKPASQKCATLQMLVPMFDSPILESVARIPPDSSISGRVNLLFHWPDLGGDRGNCGDVLNWSYELIDSKGSPVGRFSGQIPL